MSLIYSSSKYKVKKNYQDKSSKNIKFVCNNLPSFF